MKRPGLGNAPDLTQATQSMQRSKFHPTINVGVLGSDNLGSSFGSSQNKTTMNFLGMESQFLSPNSSLDRNMHANLKTHGMTLAESI